MENFDFFSFQVVRSGYLSNSFFIYFFKEVYHKRFINLAEAVEKRYISYETGKRELLKCKRYLYQFDSKKEKESHRCC
ncbi:MAG: helix-turn-helix domain-containing protein [Pseudolactococcus laudensis]